LSGGAGGMGGSYNSNGNSGRGSGTERGGFGQWGQQHGNNPASTFGGGDRQNRNNPNGPQWRSNSSGGGGSSSGYSGYGSGNQPPVADRMRQNSPAIRNMIMGPRAAGTVANALDPEESQRRRQQARPLDTRTMTKENGFLSPTFGNLVFNPFYFWVPFNIWHSTPSATASSSSTASSVMSSSTVGSGGAWTTNSNPTSSDPGPSVAPRSYTDGEVGAYEVNDDYPGWIQASIRLMHSQQKTFLPADPVIQTHDQFGTDVDREMERKASRLRELTSKFSDGERSIANHQRSLAGKKILEVKTDEMLNSANSALNQFHLTHSQAVANYENAERRYREARASYIDATTGYIDGLYCWFQSFFWECGQSEKNNLDASADALSKADVLAAKTAREFNEIYRSARSLERDIVAAKNDVRLAPEATPETLVQLQNQVSQWRAEMMKIQNEQNHPGGFYRINPSGIRFSSTPDLCQTPYVYLLARPSKINRHPFFAEDVEMDQAPKGDADMIVCLDRNSKIASIRIIDGKKNEVIQSVIQRDAQDQIEAIVIRNKEGQVLENHRWIKNEDGSTRYVLTFIPVRGREAVSIFTDLPKL